MVDRVIPVKREQSDLGGDGADDVPFDAPLNQNEDGLSARAYFIQNDSSNDSSVIVSRDASNNMTFTDPSVGTKTLSQILNPSAYSPSAIGQILISIDGVTFQPTTALLGLGGVICSETGYIIIAG